MSNTSKLLKRKRRTVKVPFAVDANDAPEVERLRREVEVARLRAEKPDPTDHDRARLADAEKALDDLLASTPLMVFHLQAIGVAANEKLMAKHPPTDEQKAEVTKAQADAGVDEAKRQSLGFNSDTYPPALIAACCKRIVTPDGEIPGDDVTPDLLAEMFDDPAWTATDQQLLLMSAMEVQQAAGAVSRDLVSRLGEG